jgi:hypothetical protein
LIEHAGDVVEHEKGCTGEKGARQDESNSLARTQSPAITEKFGVEIVEPWPGESE